jgi:flagellar motility protein MotE (MotC chaperone)
MKIRFLPILIIISILVFFTKITGIYQLSNQYFKDIFTLNVSLAQAEAPEGRKKEVKPEYVVSKEKPENINPQQNSQFDATEIDILQNLAKRRQEIDNWAKEVSTKEAVLKSAQDQLDQKIATLAKLQDELTQLLKAYNEKEDMKIKSLVKIYETMKPKDSAKIFENLDMNILLRVIDCMDQRKVAPILAFMSPESATAVTAAFANQKKLSEDVER